MNLNSVLITGAASGIGRAVAIAVSRAVPGVVLHLCDRDQAGLDGTAISCRSHGAEVLPRLQTVCDSEGMAAWIASCGHLDLVVGCAGVQFTGLFSEAETAQQARLTVEVNLLGAMNTALPALELMAAQPADRRGIRGRIALVASMGAFVSVPGASAYCASKAAVDNWTVGRAALARMQGVYLTSVCPGHVRTPMAEKNGDMHSLMEPEVAAAIILRRLERAPVRLAFPWHMMVAARFGGMLPAGLPARILARRHARRQQAA